MEPARPEIVAYVRTTFPGARIFALAGDASTRRFFRIVAEDGTRRVLMDYGAAFSEETDDIRLARVFRAAGLPVASILAADERAGCLLLEDLGDRMLEGELAHTDGALDLAFALLERAVDLAAAIAVRGTIALRNSDRSAGPALDSQRFRFEMDFFLEHFAGTLRGRTKLPAGLREELHTLADRAARTPRPVLCHRDYHSRNLMVVAGGGLAMVDIQDARWGPEGYDLASLLYDAYVDLEPAWRRPLVQRFLAGLDDSPDEEAFQSRLDVLAAQRMLKALGTFGYQITVRGADRYQSAIPRTVERLQRLLPGVPATRRAYELLHEEHLLD